MFTNAENDDEIKRRKGENVRNDLYRLLANYKEKTEEEDEEEEPLSDNQRSLLSRPYFDPDKSQFVPAVYDSERLVRLRNAAARRRGQPIHPTENEEFLLFGRKPLHFFLCIGYYLTLWSFLIGFGALLTVVQMHTGIMSRELPRLITKESALAEISERKYPHPHYYGNPALGFRPLNRDDSNLIWFVPGPAHPETWAPLVGALDAYLAHYHEHKMYGCVDCRPLKPFPPPPIEKNPFLWDKSSLSKVYCCFYIKDLGRECTKQRGYGYVEGKPCVLLKLNRLINWMPLLYPNKTSAPEEIRDRFHEKFIGVKCFGINAADKEHIGEIAYYPPEGFPFYFYPYRNQKRFRSPLVFMQFLNATPGVLIMVECRAYAQNIEIDGSRMKGSVRFELMIDVTTGREKSSAVTAIGNSLSNNKFHLTRTCAVSARLFTQLGLLLPFFVTIIAFYYHK